MSGWGAFGKMPGLGDFFRIAVPADFVAVWDAWLQTMLTAGRAALGPGWEAAYMSAPLWRFVLPQGVAGGQAMAGVLMPSVDRVGRQFPLTLAVALEGEVHGGLLLEEALWSSVEALALDCLEDDMGRDALALRLQGLALPTAARQENRAGVMVSTAGSAGGALGFGLALRGCGFLAVVEGAARAMVTPGLPGAEAAGLLFDGAWVAEEEVPA